jgi:hypothetical protein
VHAHRHDIGFLDDGQRAWSPTDPITDFKPDELTFASYLGSTPQVSLKSPADVVVEELTTDVPILPVPSTHAGQIKTVTINCARGVQVPAAADRSDLLVVDSLGGSSPGNFRFQAFKALRS